MSGFSPLGCSGHICAKVFLLISFSLVCGGKLQNSYVFSICVVIFSKCTSLHLYHVLEERVYFIATLPTVGFNIFCSHLNNRRKNCMYMFSCLILCLQMRSRHFVCFFWPFVSLRSSFLEQLQAPRGGDLGEGSWEHRKGSCRWETRIHRLWSFETVTPSGWEISPYLTLYFSLCSSLPLSLSPSLSLLLCISAFQIKLNKYIWKGIEKAKQGWCGEEATFLVSVRKDREFA